MSEVVLPQGWLKAKLSDVIQPRGEKVSPVGCDHMQFLGMDHVEAQTTKIIGSVSSSSMKSSAARFYSGDVLYGRLRPYLNKVAQPNFNGLASAEFIVFPDTKLISSKFLKFRLNASDFVSFASHLNEGDRPRVSFEQIGDFEISVPPPQEQNRIVAKIEELFSELDKGIENLKTARAQIKVYRQALLKHAFDGKLTAQWRMENHGKLETTAALQKRIQQERAQRYQQQLADWEAAGKQGSKPKAPKPLPPLTAEELAELPELPEGWGRIRIGNLLDVVSGNTPKGIENTKGTEIPYYRVSDMNRVGNEVSMNSSATYLSDREAADIGLNILPVGTIIFPKLGGAIATNKKRRLAHRSCFDLNLMGLTNRPTSLSAGYLWLWMLALDLASISDGSNVPQINNRNVEPLAFPICSPDEQALIVELAESRLSVCDQLDQTITTSLQQAEALRQSILKKAFSGQLVPQDPHDEPASALLARIKTERVVSANNAQTAAKPRKKSVGYKLSPTETPLASMNKES